MILDQDTRPERQIYHLGAILLGVLSREDTDTIDPHLVYEHMQTMFPVSSGAYLLALDWLFLLGAITIEDGRIVRCS